MVAHDAQDVVTGLPASKAVGRIGEAVEVQRAGKQGVENDQQHGYRGRRKMLLEQGGRECVDSAE